MALNNTLTVTPFYAKSFSPPLPLWRAYIIDFGASRQLAAGPGSQGPIRLPGTQHPKPLGMTSMDPYAWDVYCTGKLCEELFGVSVAWFSSHLSLTVLQYVYSRHPETQPRITKWVTQWLIGNEHGCAGICRCRPSARRGRQVLAIICWATRVWERLSSMMALGAARSRAIS